MADKENIKTENKRRNIEIHTVLQFIDIKKGNWQ